MRAFIITSVSLAAFGGLGRLLLLALANYPRTIKTSRGEEAAWIVIAIAWCAWGAYVLVTA